MAGKGGGAWKVAYADFVTAMMAFFLVMWITAQGKPIQEAVAEYFKDPFGYKSKIPGTGSAPQGNGPKKGTKSAPRGPRARGPGLAPSVAKVVPPDGPENAVPRNAHFMIIHDGALSGEGTGVQFAEGSAELDAQGQRRLKELLPLLVGKPNKIEIRAHASRRPLPPNSPFHSTWELCFARCMATLKYLEQGGVDASRIRLSEAAEFEPLTLGTGTSSEAENARVEVYQLNERVEDFQGNREERQAQNWSP